jgi:3'(2'), 5'-bisphosphate nucleotidase
MNEARPPVLDGNAAAELIEPLTEIVIAAGAAILAVNRSAMKVDGKTDGSPVTEADLAADSIIAAGLARLAPAFPRFRKSAPSMANCPTRTASSWSIRSTAPRSSSPAAMNSPSTSR